MLVSPLIAVLGQTWLSRQALQDSAPGQTFELDSRDGEPIDLLLGDQRFGRGEIVVIEGRLGVKLTELQEAEAGIRAASPDSGAEAVTVTAILGTTVIYPNQAKEIEVGCLIRFSQSADEPIDVHAEGSLVARGEVVVIEGRYGIRIKSTYPRRFGPGIPVA